MLRWIKKDYVLFIVINRSTIETFILIELIFGTGAYFIVKGITSSVLAGSIGSFIATKGAATLEKGCVSSLPA